MLPNYANLHTADSRYMYSTCMYTVDISEMAQSPSIKHTIRKAN